MSKTDTNGRPYASLSALKPGDRVEVDGGFTCLRKGEVCTVQADERGELYIPCLGPDAERAEPEAARIALFEHGERREQHGLEGSLDHDDGDSLVGVYPNTEGLD